MKLILPSQTCKIRRNMRHYTMKLAAMKR